MTRVERTSFTVTGPAGPLACILWKRDGTARPTALLVHGTGFCGSVWTSVARWLVDEFDVVAVIDSLGLEGAIGIGHSAGGTDLLLAAARRSRAFARLVVIEPTVMDPDDPTGGVATAPGPDDDALARMARRRQTFPSRQAALDRLDGRGASAGWSRAPLEAYVDDGFEQGVDGAIRLCCTPTIEGAMLRPIAAAMNGTHRADTFERAREVRFATLVVTTEHSSPEYGRMAGTATRLLANASTRHAPGVGHAVAQVDPALVARLSREFWRSF